jgi:hypothetical protein
MITTTLWPCQTQLPKTCCLAVQLSDNGANIRKPLIAEVTRLIDAYAAGVQSSRQAVASE